MNRAKPFRRLAMGGRLDRTMETGDTDHGKLDQIVCPGETHASYGNLSISLPGASTDYGFPPEKPQPQEEPITKSNRPETNKNISYTSLVSNAIDDISCSSSECDSIHEGELPSLDSNLMDSISQQTLESGMAEDGLPFPNRENFGVAGQLNSNHTDNDDNSSVYSSSSESQEMSALETSNHDLVEFDGAKSTIFTFANRSGSCTGKSETDLDCANTNTIVEKTIAPAPSSCIKYEMSSTAVFDQMVVQRNCLDTIIRSIRAFPGTDAAMEEWVCNSLARWSYDELNRKLIIDNGGFNIVLRAMIRHSTVASVQIQGCHALGNLCYGSKENSILCREEGGVTVILHAMTTCHTIEDVFIKGCYALSVMLGNDPSGIVHLKDFQLVDIIVQKMIINSQNATIQRLGCAVLWHLVPVFGATPDSGYSIAEIVNVVLNCALLCHLDDKKVQKYALGLLTKCVGFDTSEDSISLSQIYEAMNWIVLTMKVHPCEPFIMEDGCSLLLSFMEKFNKEKVFSLMLTLNLESVLVDSIWSHRDSQHVVERILAVLNSLAEHSHKYAHSISSIEGSISAIVSVMMANAINTNLQYQACMCLSTLSRHKDLQESIGSAGGIYAIVDAMRFHPQDMDVQVQAISALDDLCRIDYNAKMIFLSEGIPVVERAGNAYPESCNKSAIKIVEMANKANCSSNRRKGGPLSQVKNCCSILTTSLQKNIFYHINIHRCNRSEHDVPARETKNQEEPGEELLEDESEGASTSIIGNGRMSINEERSSCKKKTIEENQQELAPICHSTHSKRRKSKLRRIGLFDSLKRWFNEDCEDQPLEDKGKSDLVFY